MKFLQISGESKIYTYLFFLPIIGFIVSLRGYPKGTMIYLLTLSLIALASAIGVGMNTTTPKLRESARSFLVGSLTVFITVIALALSHVYIYFVRSFPF